MRRSKRKYSKLSFAIPNKNRLILFSSRILEGLSSNFYHSQESSPNGLNQLDLPGNGQTLLNSSCNNPTRVNIIQLIKANEGSQTSQCPGRLELVGRSVIRSSKCKSKQANNNNNVYYTKNNLFLQLLDNDALTETSVRLNPKQGIDSTHNVTSINIAETVLRPYMNLYL